MGTRLYRRIRRRRIALSAAAIVLFALMALYIRLRPVMRDFAMYAVTDIVNETINAAVSDRIEDGSLSYSALVTLEKDEQGAVTAVVTDMAAVNGLQTAIVSQLMRELEERGKSSTGIPLGTALGSTVFSGRGPELPVRILSAASVRAEFENRFSSAGINQTQHRIMLNVSIEVQAYTPGGRCSDEVRVSLPVAETVIVGRVPETYADISHCLGD